MNWTKINAYFDHQSAVGMKGNEKNEKKNLTPGPLEVHFHFDLLQIQSRMLYRWAMTEMRKIAKIDVYLNWYTF